MTSTRTSLDAASASELLVDMAEAGGTAAVALVVGGGPDAPVGRRIAVARAAGADSSSTVGGLGSETLDGDAAEMLREALDDARATDGLRQLESEAGTLELYVEIRRPTQELVIVGAGHIAQPLSKMGALLGFRVVVLDDRPEFATRERFPDAERVLRADFADPFADVRLHERSHVLLVTRGHKYDYDCLVRVLRMDRLPAYIGMIGSRRRVRATYAQLLEDGVDRALLGRIHAPVGLDIGAETPEEIAVAVAAELTLVRRGGSGSPLRDVEHIASRFFKDRKQE